MVTYLEGKLIDMTSPSVQFYYRREAKSLVLSIKNFDAGVNLLRYFVDDLLGDATEGFALAIKNREDAEFPTLHFQQQGNYFFLQVYSCVLQSIDGAEGWHSFVTSNKVNKMDIAQLVTVATKAPNNQEYFPVRFAEGVMFSNELLMNLDEIKMVLSHYPGQDEIRAWFKSGKCLNMGLL